MKKLAIVSYSKKAGHLQYHILQKLLQNRVLIERYSVEENSLENGIDADLIVSTANIDKIVKKFISSNGHLIIANLTILRSGFRRILSLPANTKALLVQADMREAMQCIDQIYQLGAKHLELIPYSPCNGEAGDIDVAISPGENRNVPPSVKQIVNIGNRVLDISTIMYILIYFKLEDLFNTPVMRDYCDKIMLFNFTPGLDFIHIPSNLNDVMMAYYKTGIITFSSSGFILHYNHMTEKLLGQSGRLVVGGNILNLFTQNSIQDAIKNMKPMVQKQIKINGIDLLVKIVIAGSSTAQIQHLTIEKAYESAVKMPSFKKYAIGRGYVAKYYFDDIITIEENMKKVKDIAARSAFSDSSILVTGESGTGKELLVQAIHNASKRKDNPFVAVNCAAVPETLIESELFGYDEGAFTGALHGGKMGLFELAHSGTVFLDEIGEMPVHLQARLLRVLQEKEVTRIGGQKVISVDVRVIAATNCNIPDLINAGKFRRDLYYRLNVIPLRIPPLRERVKDIPLLCEVFMRRIEANYCISAEAMLCLQQYYWEGNIRELQNYIEYFHNLNKIIIDIDDLPFPAEKEKVNQLNKEEEEVFVELRSCGENKILKYLFVLEMLKSLNVDHAQAGRRSLAEYSRQYQEKISEMEMRKLLAELEQYKMVKVCKGRKGTVLTELGVKGINIIRKSLKDI